MNDSIVLHIGGGIQYSTKVLIEPNNEIAGASLMSESYGEMARECPCKRMRSSAD